MPGHFKDTAIKIFNSETHNPKAMRVSYCVFTPIDNCLLMVSPYDAMLTF